MTEVTEGPVFKAMSRVCLVVGTTQEKQRGVVIFRAMKIYADTSEYEHCVLTESGEILHAGAGELQKDTSSSRFRNWTVEDCVLQMQSTSDRLHTLLLAGGKHTNSALAEVYAGRVAADELLKHLRGEVA